MTVQADILIPPEGVPLHFPVAGFGVRVGAQITDILITGLAAIAIVVLLTTTEVLSLFWLGSVAMALFFFIRIPYYVLSELAWNGQTLGKKLMKIKVVANDGGPLTTHALVLRNLMKEAEIFLPATLVLSLDAEQLIPSLIAFAWTAGTVLVMFLNPRRRRLGDMMAGTYVIHLPEPRLLKDLSADPMPWRDEAEGFTFLSHQLEHYGAYELQTLEKILRAEETRPENDTDKHRREATRAAIVDRIRAKIDYADAVPPDTHLTFLRTFYNAQREYLEQKQIFGETRADKFHRDQKSEEPAHTPKAK